MDSVCSADDAWFGYEVEPGEQVRAGPNYLKNCKPFARSCDNCLRGSVVAYFVTLMCNIIGTTISGSLFFTPDFLLGLF